MTAEERYQLWCQKATEDAVLAEELRKMAGDENTVKERFTTDLKFGTAGLRGILGAGTSFMNIYTVRRATQGLADYLKSAYTDAISVAIAYDSRINSELFSRESAAVLAANGIRAYLYPELMPTPMLSYAVRTLGCKAGINVTASHNPSQYNGYKVYGADGCQMTDDDANAVFNCIEKLDLFDDVKTVPFEQGVKDGRICYISSDINERYLEKVAEQSVTPNICRETDLKVIYTPLNGTGNKPVRAILNRIGVRNVTVVPEQELPNGNFPTCPYPNPEIRQVYECGLKLAQQDEPDLLLATDPDCDRVGMAVRDGDDYRLFTGNEIGALMLNYILSQRTALGTLPENPIAVKSIVSTPLVNKIGAKYGCRIVDVLTGFKYIGEQILHLVQQGTPGRYIFGFEESYGYLAGTYVRDKDAVFASMLICEMAAFYKKQGKTLVNVLHDIAEEFGYFCNKVSNFEFKSLAGAEKMRQLMEDLRRHQPTAFCGRKVIRVADYLNSVETDCITGKTEKINLPKSNVLSFVLEGDAAVIIRPSGTEPKIKTYVSASAATEEGAQKLAAALAEEIAAKMC